MNPPNPTAIVVGAGLSGLTAAYRLRKAGWDVKVLEASDGVGGRVRTVLKRGYLMDTGATVICASYHAYMSLAKEIGLDEEMMLTNHYVGVVRNGCIHELDIRHMGRSALKTKLLSLRSKVLMSRLVVDLIRARAKGLLDYTDMRKAAPLDTESAREYVLQTMNEEIDECLCEPMVRSMLLANSDKVSRVEFFSAMVNGFGNRFLCLKGGQVRFAQNLAQNLDVRLQSPVYRVRDNGDHVAVTWKTKGRDPETEKATACVVSCPLPVARSICKDYEDILRPLDEKLDYTKSIAVGIGSTVVPRTRAFLVQLSSRESKEIAVCFLEHNKASDRTPGGRAMITALWETDAAAPYLAADDATIVAKTLETVVRIFPQIDGHIDLTHATRWPLALPFTRVGAYRAIGDFHAGINPGSRVQFAADFMSAAGQNTAVEFGTCAARTLDTAFGIRSSRP